MECIERTKEDSGCEGEVAPRMSLTGTGTPIVRCDKHWELRLQLQEKIQSKYLTHAPADFDPSYAGERWDEED